MKLNKILTAALFIALGLGELQRLPGLPLYSHDIILAALLLVNFRRLRLLRPVIWFGLAGLISLFWATVRLPLSQVLTGSLYLFRFIFYSLLINLKIKPGYLIITSTLVAVFGLVQYLAVPDTRFLFNLNWDEHYFRLLSTLYDPNFTGIILVLGLILIYWYRRKSWWLYLLHLSALLLTYSRSSYLALLAAAATLAVIKKKFKIVIFILMFLSLLVFLPRPGGEGVKLERVTSIVQRLANYRLGLELWQSQPLVGIGFNTLRYFRDNQLSHSASGLDSSLLLVLTTTGVVGLAAYLNLLNNLWRRPAVVKITLAALFTHSLFVNSLFYSFTLIWLWVVASLKKE